GKGLDGPAQSRDARSLRQETQPLVPRQAVLPERRLQAAHDSAQAALDVEAADVHAVMTLPGGDRDPRQPPVEERLPAVAVGRKDRHLVVELPYELLRDALHDQLGSAHGGKVALSDVKYPHSLLRLS